MLTVLLFIQLPQFFLQNFTYAIHPFSVVNVSKSLIETQFLTELGVISVDDIVLRYKV